MATQSNIYLEAHKNDPVVNDTNATYLLYYNPFLDQERFNTPSTRLALGTSINNNNKVIPELYDSLCSIMPTPTPLPLDIGKKYVLYFSQTFPT